MKFAFGACVVMILLYTSRVVYNLIAVIKPSIIDFGYNWVNVSDQVRDVYFGLYPPYDDDKHVLISTGKA